MWCRRSALVSSLAVLQLLLGGCIDFDAARARYCQESAGGCAVDPGPGTSGEPDAGPVTPVPPALRLQALSGSTAQTARVGAVLTLGVAVTDAQGAGVAGVRVDFSAPAAGASGSFAGGSTLGVETDAAGEARVQLTANALAGSFEVSARSEAAEGVATFALTTVVPVPSALQLDTADTVEVVVGGTLPSVRARVLDQLGEALAGVPVRFQFSSTLQGATWPGGSKLYTATSDAQGEVSTPQATANTRAGGYGLALSVEDTQAGADVALRNLPDAPVAVVRADATALEAPVMQAFPTLRFVVEDRHGNPVPNHPVRLSTWPMGSPAQAKFGASDTATATTDVSGVFTLPTLTANRYVGTFRLQVFLQPSDILTNHNFDLMQRAGPAAQLTVLSGHAQGTLAGALFAPLAVSVVDEWSNPVQTGRVSFVAPDVLAGAPTAFFGAGTATSTFVDLATAPEPGIASVVPRANATAASTPYPVTAQYEGTTLKHVFALANDKYALRLDPDERVELRDGASLTLTVRVTNAAGAPVANHAVLFTAPLGSGTFFKSSTREVTLTTDANGEVRDVFTSNDCYLAEYPVEVNLPDASSSTGMVLTYPARFMLENLTTTNNC